MEESASFIVFVFVFLLFCTLYAVLFQLLIRFLQLCQNLALCLCCSSLPLFKNLYLSTKTFPNFASCRSAISFVCRLCFFLRRITVFFSKYWKTGEESNCWTLELSDWFTFARRRRPLWCCSLKTAPRSNHPFKTRPLLHTSTNFLWSITDQYLLHIQINILSLIQHFPARTTETRNNTIILIYHQNV